MVSSRMGTGRLGSIAAMLCIAMLLGCYMRSGLKATSYGNVHFLGSGSCDTVTISADLNPTNVELLLPDGRQVYTTAISKDSVVMAFGPPKKTIEYPGKGTYEDFAISKCKISFLNGKFSTLEAREGVKVVNLSNKKSLTLPASESEIREVFGEPTEVEYLQSQQP